MSISFLSWLLFYCRPDSLFAMPCLPRILAKNIVNRSDRFQVATATGWPDPSWPGPQAVRIPVGQTHRLAGSQCVKPTGCPDPIVSSPQAGRIPLCQAHRLSNPNLPRRAKRTSWPTGCPDPNWPGPQAGRIPVGQAHSCARPHMSAKRTSVPICVAQ